MNKFNKIEKIAFLVNKKIEAINNKTRLALMGLLYIRNDRIFSELSKEVDMDSNKIAYHLNILIESDLVKRSKGKYKLTGVGKRFLKEIGFAQNIEKIYEIHKTEISKTKIYNDNISTILRSLSKKSYYHPQIKSYRAIVSHDLINEFAKRKRKKLWVAESEMEAWKREILKKIDTNNRGVINKFESCVAKDILKDADFGHPSDVGKDLLTARQNKKVMFLVG